MRSDIVQCARAFIGTPFAHQGRTMGLGIDCIGQVWGAHVSAGFEIPVPPCDYPRVAVDFKLHERLAEHFDQVPIEEARFGDTLSFAFHRGKPQHVGVLSSYWLGGPGLVHCWTGAKRACEHALTRSWLNRCVGAWRPRGLVEALP